MRPMAVSGRDNVLKVWGRRSWFNVQKGMWLAGELELAHAHVDAGGRTMEFWPPIHQH
jgi:hypothetical protein